MTKNRLSNLTDHLFMQIERLANEELTPEQIDAEVKRGGAIVGAADMILRHASLQVQAAKVISDHGNGPTPYLSKFSAPAGQLIEARKQ
jgi:hypothetical protein